MLRSRRRGGMVSVVVLAMVTAATADSACEAALMSRPEFEPVVSPVVSYSLSLSHVHIRVVSASAKCLIVHGC